MEVEHIPNLCSVTDELVREVANSNPEVFIKNNVISTHAVLFYLGFKLDRNDYLKGIRVVKDVWVRCHKDPHLVYKTTTYNGSVRKAIDKVHSDGTITYNKNKWHKLKSEYEKYEVLQPKNIYSYIPKDEMENVLNIGSILHYNKGIQ